jgi:hypothetical protein
VGRRGSHPACAQSAPSAAFAVKKNSASRLLDRLDKLLEASFHGCQTRVGKRLQTLALSNLACLGRHTVSGWLEAAGEGSLDWSGAYRLFSQQRFEVEDLFGCLRRGVVAELDPGADLVVAMDDTLLLRGGRRTPGVGWRRDPLGPPFQVNFVRGQRFLQISAAVPQQQPPGAARSIPIELLHTPTAVRPSHKASHKQQQQYRLEQKRKNLSRRGAEQLQRLRRKLDEDGDSERRLCVLADGRFTNASVWKKIPQRTVLIGRIRSDAQLYRPADPAQAAPTGRRRVYGERLPTPRQILCDETIPLVEVEAYAAGRRHRFPVKTMGPVLWRAGAGSRPLRLVVIKPLRYRLGKNSRLLYRQAALLIVSDPTLSLQDVVQRYVWRWEIEVNFRDEKTLLGVGQAQVFNERSVECAPQFQVGCYGLLLLAARQAFADSPAPLAVPAPKWRAGKSKPRATTLDLLKRLRQELWGDALQARSFSRLCSQSTRHPTRQKPRPALAAAVLGASP